VTDKWIAMLLKALGKL